MERIDLNKYQLESDSKVSMEEDGLLELLESEGVNVPSMESNTVGAITLGAGAAAFKNIKEFIVELLSGSESINKKYKTILKEMESEVDTLSGKERRSIRTLSGVIYSERKKSYLTDIPSLIKSDVKFIESVIKLVNALDSVMDQNVKVMETTLSKFKGESDFSEFVKVDVLPNLTSIDTVYNSNKFRGDTLYNGAVVYKENSSGTPLGLYLEYGSGKTNLKERARTNFNPYMVKSDVKAILSGILQIAEKTEELIDIMKDLEDKYDVKTGPAHKRLRKLEQELLDEVSTTEYLKGVGVLIDVNMAILKTLDRLPRVTVSRNIKLLKIFTKYGKGILNKK